MANKLMEDKMAVEITTNIDTRKIISSYFPDWMDIAQNVHCPFHDDAKTKSYHIDPSGKAYCHGCGHKAFDIVALVADIEELTRAEARLMLYEQMVGNMIPESKVLAFVNSLTKKALEYLSIHRNIDPSKIKEHKLGVDPKTKRVTIPIYDRFGVCRNIRYMATPESDSVYKAINEKGMGAIRLFPEQRMTLEKKVLLVEGEFDCLVGRSFGLPAVTWTGGAMSWGDEHTMLFKDKLVWICYDTDEAGKEGAKKAKSNLEGVASVITIVDGPANKGKDISNWANTVPSFLLKLKDDIKAYPIPKRKQVCICPTCRRPL